MVEYYVVLGDVVRSRDIEDREAFQEDLEAACREFTATERDDVLGDFKILKGVDEFGGVLQSLENVYEIASAFQKRLRPHEVRIVVAAGSIDVGLTSWDVEKMDGEAFHRASARLAEIEDGPFSFDLLVDDDALARAVADEINLLLHLRGDWTDRQWEVASARERVETQTAAAEELGVTQQAVSNVLSGANWPLVHEIETRLRATLGEYADSRREGDAAVDTGVDDSTGGVSTSRLAVPPDYVVVESEGDRFDAASAHRMYADDLREDGEYDEAAEHYEQALDLDAEYAAAHLGYGNLLLDREKVDEAAARYERALELYRAEENREGEASALGNLGLVAQERGEFDAAAEYHERSLGIKREMDDSRGEARSLHNLGSVALRRGDLDAAEQYYEASLAIEREVDDRRGEADALHNLGLVARKRGDLDAAAAYHEESLAVEREVGDRRGEARSRYNLGLVAQERGEFDAAAEQYRDALAAFREMGDRHDTARCLANLGLVAQERGDLDAAEQYHGESRAAFREVGDMRGEAGALHNLGLVAEERGDLDAAAAYHEESLAGMREVDDSQGAAGALRHLGEVAVAREEYGDARRYFRESLDADASHTPAVFKYAALAVDAEEYDDALDRLRNHFESSVGSGGEQALVAVAAESLHRVVEPALANASDDAAAESVLSFLIQLAERTAGTASDDLEAWALAQHARVTGPAHDRVNESTGSPELRASDAYCTALGFLLGGEPAAAVQPLKRAWRLRGDLDESGVEYAASSGVALLGCADLLGPSVLDAEWDDIHGELVDGWRDALREPARTFLERGGGAGDATPDVVADAVHDDDREQFAALEARAFASLLSMLREQAEREA